jgi:hypothetical protein
MYTSPMTYKEAVQWLKSVGGRVERDDWPSGAMFQCVVHLAPYEPCRSGVEEPENEEDKAAAILQAISDMKRAVDAARRG